MMLAFWIMVLLLIYWAGHPDRSSGSADDYGPLRTLNERLARGEIDSEEYEERRAVLEARR
jgi:uncharacterized membrane protein